MRSHRDLTTTPNSHLKQFGSLYLFPIAAIVMVYSIAGSNAHESTEIADNIIVENAAVEIAESGTRHQLHFDIVNLSADNIILYKVRTDAAKAVELKMNLPGQGYTVVSSIPILREEKLDLDTTHIKVELTGTARRLSRGTEIEFELVFQNFVKTAFADVH